jgi:hypothetical protein
MFLYVTYAAFKLAPSIALKFLICIEVFIL